MTVADLAAARPPMTRDAPLRVVILSMHSPYPPTNGSRIRLASLVAALSAQHDLRLFLLTDETEPNLNRLRARGISVTRVQHAAWDRLSLPCRTLHNLTALARGTTPVFESVRGRATDAQIRSAVAGADVVIIDTTSLAPYAAELRRVLPTVRIIINTHDVDSALYERLASSAPNPLARIHKRLLAANARRLEGSFHRFADGVLVVSDADGRALSALNHGAVPVFVVPNAVDTDALRPLPQADSPTLIFCGVLNYQPNVDGIRWFVHHVLPAVRSAIPNALLLLVGRRPAPEVSALADRSGIQVFADVDDVRPFYARSAIAIVPLLAGGGTRLKILEAMALGRVVVSTTLGAEGIPPSAGVIVADDPQAFAGELIRLLREGLPEAIIAAAIRDVEVHSSWHAITTRMNEIISPR